MKALLRESLGSGHLPREITGTSTLRGVDERSPRVGIELLLLDALRSVQHVARIARAVALHGDVLLSANFLLRLRNTIPELPL